MPTENATTTPEASAMPATVLVYNHSPATYIHGTVVVPPGAEAEMPVEIADKWRRVSHGLVSTSKASMAERSDSEAALRLERAKTAALEDKIRRMEERQAELEAKAAKNRRAA